MTLNLVGVKEIADLAGVRNSAVSNWRERHPSFPRPLADLACGPVWDAKPIKDWIKKHEKERDS
jgi:hypothetical protein